MTKIYFAYDNPKYFNNDAEEGDGPYLYQGTYDGDYTVRSAHLTPGDRDAFETNETIGEGDTVYVVYVVYGDGDTFGSSGGYSQIVAVTKDEDLAFKARDWAKSPDTEWNKFDAGWPETLGAPPYPQWSGHFNWVQAVRLEDFRVKA